MRQSFALLAGSHINLRKCNPAAKSTRYPEKLHTILAAVPHVGECIALSKVQCRPARISCAALRWRNAPRLRQECLPTGTWIQ